MATPFTGAWPRSSKALRVYSFGASGALLSQYLIWARHAVHEYGARAVIINVVGNDFDESHVAVQYRPGMVGLRAWTGREPAPSMIACTYQDALWSRCVVDY
jgi:hypothetical protein